LSEKIDQSINDAFRKRIQEAKIRILEKLQEGEKKEYLSFQDLVGLKLLFPEAFGEGVEERTKISTMADDISRIVMLKGLFPEAFSAKRVEEGEKREAKDEIDKALERQAKIATIRAMQMQSGFPFGTQLIPALDKDGKPMVDSSGTPVYKVVPTAFPSQPQQTDQVFELLKIEKERAGKLEEKLIDTVKESTAKDTKILEDRIKDLESRDPLAYFTNVVDKLRNLELFKTSPESLEVTKLKTDLQKWMHEESMKMKRWSKEQDIAFRKWLDERKEHREEMKQAREQIKELGKTLRAGMKEVGGPLAKAVGEGVREGAIRRKPAAASQAPKKTIQEMSEGELRDQLKKAEEAERVVTEAKRKIIEELNRRSKASSGESGGSSEG